LATVLVDDDVTNLPLADEKARQKIFSLRENLIQTVHEKAPLRRNIEFDIIYELKVEGIQNNEI